MRIRSPNLKAPWTICLKHSLIPRCTLWKRCPIARELTIGAHLFRVWQLLSFIGSAPNKPNDPCYNMQQHHIHSKSQKAWLCL
jgi:hypothetical protein